MSIAKKFKSSEPCLHIKIVTLLNCHKERVGRLSLNIKVILNIIAFKISNCLQLQKHFIVMGINSFLKPG